MEHAQALTPAVPYEITEANIRTIVIQLNSEYVTISSTIFLYVKNISNNTF